MELEKLVLDMLIQVRPKGIEPEAYPQLVSTLVGLIMLELTKGQ